jgi:hypothetical protein
MICNDDLSVTLFDCWLPTVRRPMDNGDALLATEWRGKWDEY